ncbi:hypothetical protein, conserved [Plasmodium ovale]|uniref:PIR protein n=1 Tax=Plasmodium ovale TaxID=36330 RepID=A0A1C3KHZ7_PLAOA|nr:hypothetical protein, conserved [Plasmodium ovale]
MADEKVSREERYVFFERIDTYMPQAESAEKKNVSKEKEDFCKSFLSDNFFKYISFPPKFCVQFKHLYDLLLNSTKSGKASGSLDKHDCAFINYWLNDKLRGINIDNSIYVNEFYKQIKAKNNEIFKDELLNKKLHNIEKHELENMRKLYDLYNIKDKISIAITEGAQPEESASCLSYAKECYKKYKEAVINCSEACSYFYDLLTDFKNKYKEELTPFADSPSSCNYKELFEFEDYRTLLREYESGPFKNIITLPVLIPMCGVFLMFLYSNMFTPFRQRVLEKIKKTRNMLFDAGERHNGSLLYTYDDDKNIFNEGEYNISYYTVRSS